MKAIELLEDSPVIAAVKDDEGLEKSLTSECQVVFFLYGTICNIAELVRKAKQAGKYAVVHVDLIQGLGSKEIAVDYICTMTQADGIISTKPSLIKRAKELGKFGILRVFMIDSMALDGVKKQIDAARPDMLEIMPGIVFKVLKNIHAYTKIPLIAGGLISEKKEIMEAFSAGADAISTTNQELWFV